MVTQPMPSLADFPAIVFHIWDNWQIYHVGTLRRTRYHMVTHATTCIHSCPIYTVRLSKYAWRPNTTQFKVQAVCLVLNAHHSFDQRKKTISNATLMHLFIQKGNLMHYLRYCVHQRYKRKQQSIWIFAEKAFPAGFDCPVSCFIRSFKTTSFLCLFYIKFKIGRSSPTFFNPQLNNKKYSLAWDFWPTKLDKQLLFSISLFCISEENNFWPWPSDLHIA